MKILILGDVGSSDSNCRAFLEADPDLFSSGIQDLCREADIVLLNLEKPLTDELSPLGKCPPDYHAPAGTINGIKMLHPTAVTLANNHIMDQQLQGLQSTVRILEQNGILSVGAGCNIAEAREPLIVTKQDYRVGIYACCEREFSFAAEKSAGANPFDPLETFDDIEALKKDCDYLIVLFHGGMQGYPYPTPYQQKVCRKMCEKGANLVVCQHSHIIGCEETAGNSRIIYGQGNFLLDDTTEESWQSGLIIEVQTDQDDTSVTYIPVKTQGHKAIIHPDANPVMEAFHSRSMDIKEAGRVEKLFAEFSNRKLSDYLLKLSGKSSFVRRAFGRLGITAHYKMLYSKEACYRILDYLYCDSHREAIEYGLNRFLQEKEEK